MEINEYTDKEIRKNLALLEIHLKQAVFGDEVFCDECIRKHILILEGLAEEGLTACIDCDTKKYKDLLDYLNKIQDKNFREEGIELAKQIRKLRKMFVPCKGENVGMKDRDDVKEKIKELEDELKLSQDNITKERLNYGISLLRWVLRGRRCLDG